MRVAYRPYGRIEPYSINEYNIRLQIIVNKFKIQAGKSYDFLNRVPKKFIYCVVNDLGNNFEHDL